MEQGSFRTVELSNPAFEFEGLRFLTVKSNNLKGRGDICLFVPKLKKPLSDLPIYILLHGVYGSAWVWALKAGAHQTVNKLMQNNTIKPAILAMPSDGLWGDGSGYLAHNQKDFGRWIVEEVPLAIQENIPEASLNSPLCIGGLSMGGYGALLLGNKHPEKFKAISAHSAITRFEELKLFVEEPLADYGQKTEHPDVIDVIKNRSGLPPIRFDCGLDDELLEGNRLLHKQLNDFNIPHTYEEFKGGHEWKYWQKHVGRTLRFFNDILS